jgi:hypothetical protein
MKRNSGSGVADGSDLQRLAAAVREPDRSRRWARLSETLDVDRFLTFMAMEVLIGHRDGYCLARNNFRLYHDPAADRFVFLPDGMDQLFGRADFPVQPHMAGVVAAAVMDTPAGWRAYRERVATLFTNCFQVGVLTNRVRAWTAAVAPKLTRAEARAFQRAASDLCERIERRTFDVARQLTAPESAPMHFEAGVARLGGWRAVDPPAGGQLERATVGGRATLRIHAGPRTSASWRTIVRLEPGRYRFEGLARTAGVKALGFGRNHGASVGVRGQKAAGSRWLTGDTDWTKLQTEFEVSAPKTDVELICALRAGAGDTWFELDSLQLVRVDPKRE